MRNGPEKLRLDDGHPGGGLPAQRQKDWTGHLMAASSETGSDGEPDKGEPKIKAVPGNPEWVEYLKEVEW